MGHNPHTFSTALAMASCIHPSFIPSRVSKLETTLAGTSPLMDCLPFTVVLSFFSFSAALVFVPPRGFSLAVASGGYSSLWWEGFSLQWLLLLRSTGSTVHGLQQLCCTDSVDVT